MVVVCYIYNKQLPMKKYALLNRSGESISTTTADNFEDAISFFCFRKKFDRFVLLHLFDVVIIN